MFNDIQSVLLVSGDERHRLFLTEALEHLHVAASPVRDLQEARSRLEREGRGIVVVPYRGATLELLEFLETERETASRNQIILLCDERDAPMMHQYVELGAFDYVPQGQGPSRLLTAIRNATAHLEFAQRLQELNEIGVALGREHDLGKLLDLIVRKCREITSSDAGSLYLKVMPDDEREPAVKRGAASAASAPPQQPLLEFTVAQNFSLETGFKKFRMPLTRKSLSGYVALTGNVINIPDCYRIQPGVDYGFDTTWDKKSGYRTTSMLVVPMRDHKGAVIGVIQLINRKRRWNDRLTPQNALAKVIPFGKEHEELALSVASQAGVSIENTRLLRDLEQTFYGFVSSSAQAIEARDKSTKGHSDRIRVYAEAIARRINEKHEGPFADVNFSEDQIKELSFSAILHDIGKIGVPEHVLLKSHRLSEPQLSVVTYRFNYYKAFLKEQTFRGYVNKIVSGEVDYLGAEADRLRTELDKTLRDRIAKIDEYLKFIVDINGKGWISDEQLARLNEIRAQRLVDIDGQERPYLSDDEYEHLAVRRGNLTGEEREQINSHVVHTFNILSKIPWGKTGLHDVATIAGCHHERNDGSGYPWRLLKDEIPIQARILAVADVYEALTATDRPYKPAMPIPKALGILEEDAKANKLDPDITRLFIDDRLFEVVDLKKEKADSAPPQGPPPAAGSGSST